MCMRAWNFFRKVLEITVITVWHTLSLQKSILKIDALVQLNAHLPLKFPKIPYIPYKEIVDYSKNIIFSEELTIFHIST